MSQQVPLTSKKLLSHEDHHLYELIITNKRNSRFKYCRKNVSEESVCCGFLRETFDSPEKTYSNKEQNSCSTKQVFPPRTPHPVRGGAPDRLTDCSRFAFCSPACGPFIKHVSAFQRRLGPLAAFQTPARRPRAPDKRLDHLEGRRPSFVSTGKHEWVAGGD